MSPLSNLRSSPKPLLCYVTDRRSLPGLVPETSPATLLQKIEQVASAGVDWVQIREKDLAARELAALTRKILQSARASSSEGGAVRILVNDRLDIALAEGAGGVHLGEKSLPVQEAKRLVLLTSPRSAGAGFLLGVSGHSLEAARAAEDSGADYIFFGPVFATPSKAAFGEPQGVERLGQVCRAVAIPVIAVGGITVENAAACLDSGAAGLAAIRLFQNAPDIPLVVSKLIG